jgi:hypothetical protein
MLKFETEKKNYLKKKRKEKKQNSNKPLKI